MARLNSLFIFMVKFDFTRQLYNIYNNSNLLAVHSFKKTFKQIILYHNHTTTNNYTDMRQILSYFKFEFKI